MSDRNPRRGVRKRTRTWRMVAMHQRSRLPATLAVIAIVLVGCSPPSGGPTVGTGPPATPAPATPAPATPAPSASPTRTAPHPSATGSGDLAVVVPGEFTVCVPSNSELRAGTDEQFVVPHPEGDM